MTKSTKPEMPSLVARYKSIRDNCLNCDEYAALRAESIAVVNRDHPNLPLWERAMKVREVFRAAYLDMVS